MLTASALPMTGGACCNLRMLQGPALGTAIANAMKLKAERMAVSKITQAALASALGMTQPSVSELLKYGRLAKENVPTLLDYFSDVVGPDHFGLPFSKFEMDLVRELRKLPAQSQAALMDRVRLSVAAVEEATKGIDAPLEVRREKRRQMTANVYTLPILSGDTIPLRRPTQMQGPSPVRVECIRKTWGMFG